MFKFLIHIKQYQPSSHLVKLYLSISKFKVLYIQTVRKLIQPYKVYVKHKLNLHKIVFPKSLCLSNDQTVLSRFVYISTCMCTVCKVSSILLVAILIKHMMARLVSLIVTTPHWQVHLERGVYLCLCHTSMLHFN